MENASHLGTTVAWLGFGLAFIFGFVANKTNFCTMGAVSDVVNMGDWGRMRAWLLAIAVAMIGTNALVLMGYLDLAKTIYTAPNFIWLAYLVGGLSFGVGMTLASGCANKCLVRVGGGNLKSVVVFLFLGYSALVTLKGIFGVFRVSVLQAPAVSHTFSGSQSLPFLLEGLFGLDHRTLQIVITAILAGSILIFCFMNREFLRSPDNILAGVVIGLIITAGWYVTGKIGFAENPDTLEMTFFGTNSHLAESMSFVAPTSYTMDLWAYWSDVDTVVTFGIATVFGIGIGSFVYALLTKSFRWEGFTSPQDMFRHIIGAVLMGFGGVTAVGCTVGQGMSGVSTLSLGSFLAFLSIVAGAAITMKIQYYLMMREA
ncbi:MAG: YeeE/YedE family protein [Burkholderiales bacterium]